MTNKSPEFDPEALAEELRVAESERRGVRLPTDRWPDFSWDDARATARARDRIRIAAGERLIGYKLGWTSAAMREALGIDRPNWGTLWSSQLLDGAMSLDSMIHPKVEPEFIYHAGSNLEGNVSVDEVAAACSSWSVGIEVVDPRFPSFDFRWLDNTADGSSAAGICVGPTIPGDSFEQDPSELTLSFTNGSEIHSGNATQTMGSPLTAVAWLVEQLATEGQRLEAGHLVFTGGITAPFDVRQGATYSISSEQLGACSLVVR